MDKIREVIVVEGRDDRNAILRAVHADTIETGGSAMPDDVIERIRLAQERRGVIIFTDPDGAGERIRTKLSQLIPGCKHAFLRPSEARTSKGIGVEYASPDAVRQALAAVRDPAFVVPPQDVVDREDLMDAGLLVHIQAASRRAAVGDQLRIGYANGQQFLKRCQLFHIRKSEFWDAVRLALPHEEWIR
jgi:ribonuclease M5